jgi:hypothetical protein
LRSEHRRRLTGTFVASLSMLLSRKRTMRLVQPAMSGS